MKSLFTVCVMVVLFGGLVSTTAQAVEEPGDHTAIPPMPVSGELRSSPNTPTPDLKITKLRQIKRWLKVCTLNESGSYQEVEIVGATSRFFRLKPGQRKCRKVRIHRGNGVVKARSHIVGSSYPNRILLKVPTFRGGKGAGSAIDNIFSLSVVRGHYIGEKRLDAAYRNVAKRSRPVNLQVLNICGSDGRPCWHKVDRLRVRAGAWALLNDWQDGYHQTTYRLKAGKRVIYVGPVKWRVGWHVGRYIAR